MEKFFKKVAKTVDACDVAATFGLVIGFWFLFTLYCLQNP